MDCSVRAAAKVCLFKASTLAVWNGYVPESVKHTCCDPGCEHGVLIKCPFRISLVRKTGGSVGRNPIAAVLNDFYREHRCPEHSKYCVHPWCYNDRSEGVDLCGKHSGCIADGCGQPVYAATLFCENHVCHMCKRSLTPAKQFTHITCDGLKVCDDHLCKRCRVASTGCVDCKCGEPGCIALRTAGPNSLYCEHHSLKCPFDADVLRINCGHLCIYPGCNSHPQAPHSACVHHVEALCLFDPTVLKNDCGHHCVIEACASHREAPDVKTCSIHRPRMYCRVKGGSNTLLSDCGHQCKVDGCDDNTCTYMGVKSFCDKHCCPDRLCPFVSTLPLDNPAHVCNVTRCQFPGCAERCTSKCEINPGGLHSYGRYPKPPVMELCPGHAVALGKNELSFCVHTKLFAEFKTPKNPREFMHHRKASNLAYCGNPTDGKPNCTDCLAAAVTASGPAPDPNNIRVCQCAGCKRWARPGSRFCDKPECAKYDSQWVIRTRGVDVDAVAAVTDTDSDDDDDGAGIPPPRAVAGSAADA